MSKLETNTIDTVSGTTNLVIGSTNTSTIALGASGDTVTVPNGALTGQNYPAFEAHLGSSQLFSDNTQVKINFNTKDFDTDNCYDNTTNYRFTPNVAGKYFVFSCVRFDGRQTTNLNLIHLQIYKNGSVYKANQSYFIASYIRQMSVTINAVIDMNGSSDYLEMYGYLDMVNASLDARFSSGSSRDASFGAYRIGA